MERKVFARAGRGKEGQTRWPLRSHRLAVYLLELVEDISVELLER